MRTEQKTVNYYKFSELSDKAKERARNWYRDGIECDFSAECVVDDAKTIAALFGFDIKKVYYSGFWSQGDGVKALGSYRYKVGAARSVKAHAPMDHDLLRIVTELGELQRKNRFSLCANIGDSGRYQHSGCTEIEVYRSDERDVTDDDAKQLKQLLREYMDWIYRNLERDYEYQISDECVDESIEINEYEFDEDGERI